MIGGWIPILTDVLLIGYVVGAALLLQFAIGKRWIKLKGRTHARVHRYAAWVLVALAAAHAALALIYAYHWRIFA